MTRRGWQIVCVVLVVVGVGLLGWAGLLYHQAQINDDIDLSAWRKHAEMLRDSPLGQAALTKDWAARDFVELVGPSPKPTDLSVPYRFVLWGIGLLGFGLLLAAVTGSINVQDDGAREHESR